MADSQTPTPQPQQQTEPIVPDSQFAEAEKQIKQELAQSPVLGSLLDRAVDESERRSRDRIITQLEEFKYKQKLANLFARSGCFADIKGASADQAIAQAFTKIALGESMGFSAAESMQGVDLISGRPAVGSHLRAARMQRAGYSWDIDWFEQDGVCSGVRLWLYKNGQPMLQTIRNADGTVVLNEDGTPKMQHVSVSFMKSDAERMMTKIWEWSQQERKNVPRTASILEKDNWKNTPRNMYWARCITNAQRWYAPGVLSGDVPSTEEALDGLYGEDGGMSSGSVETLEMVRDRKLQAAAEWHAAHGRQMPTNYAGTPSPEVVSNGSPEGEGGSTIADALVASGNPTQVGDTTVAAVGPNAQPQARKPLFGKGGAK